MLLNVGSSGSMLNITDKRQRTEMMCLNIIKKLIASNNLFE